MKGQGFLETLIGVSLMMMLGIVGLVLLLKGLGTIIATKWAAENSRCVAIQKNQMWCGQKTGASLKNDFSLHHVIVKSQIIHGVIHSTVQGDIGEYAFVQGKYDLGPSEYKRVSQ